MIIQNRIALYRSRSWRAAPALLIRRDRSELRAVNRGRRSLCLADDLRASSIGLLSKASEVSPPKDLHTGNEGAVTGAVTRLIGAGEFFRYPCQAPRVTLPLAMKVSAPAERPPY